MKQVWQSVWRSGVRSPYAACALPFAVGLLSLVYLSVQWYTKDWAVKSPDRQSASAATPVPAPEVSPTPTPAPALEFGRLLQAPDSFKSKFEDALRANEPGNYTREDWRQVVTASGLTAWRFTTGLVLVALLAALLISFIIISLAPRRDGFWRRPGYALLWLGVCVVIFLVSAVFFRPERAAVVARQFLDFIDAQMVGSSVWPTEVFLLYAGYLIVIYMLFASGSTLLPFRFGRGGARQSSEVDAEARDLAARMNRLRLLLYVGAFMMAVGALRGKLNQEWALGYLPPVAALEGAGPQKLAATLFYERIKAAGSNNVTSVALLNTLLLAAIYVPAALVLQRRADALYKAAARAPAAAAAPAAPEDARKEKEGDASAATGTPAAAKRPTREEWMRERGLSFPLKEHLGRVAAILSPLLAGPLGDLLGFLKG